MVIKSNKSSIYLRLLVYSFGIAVFIIILLCFSPKRPWAAKETVFILVNFGLIILAGLFEIIRHWIAFGREIELTEEGCTVRFLKYSRSYRWDQMRTKKRCPLQL